MPAYVLALVALVAAAACSADAPKRVATRKTGSTTSTSIVVGSKVIGGGSVLENQVTTFDIDNGLVKVLVPIGAVSKGTEVEVREVTGAPGDLGAVQRAGKVYDVSFKNGKLLANKKVTLQFATGSSQPSDDPRPVGGLWDDESGVWRAAENDESDATTLTVYASRPGKYTWLRWNWDKAVQAGTDTIRALVGPLAPTENALQCDDTAAARTRFDVQTNVGSALAWCIGRSDGTDVLRVLNTGQAPLTVRYKGLGTPRSNRENPLATKLAAALAPYWNPQDGELVRIVAPGEEVDFPISDPTAKALLRAELNGFTQHYDVVSAAVAFTAGFYAGNAAVATSVLESDPTVRDALVARLAGQGCANGLGDTVTIGSYPTDKLAAYAALLVSKCIDAETAKLVMKASVRTTLGNLRSSFPVAVPTTTEQQFDPAMRTALSPLVEPVGGPVAGEIIVSPRGAGATSPTPTLTPTGTAAPVQPTVSPGATTATTTATTTPPLFGTTTVETAPPTVTTTAARTTTTATTVAPTTAATTVAPTTTTTTRPAPTTTTTAALAPLVFTITGTCTTAGGTLTATTGNFTPSAPWSVTFWSPPPTRTMTTSGGNANGNGTINWTFSCVGAETGRWDVEVSQGARLVRTTFEVASVPGYSYDTSSAPQNSMNELSICSNGTPLGSPGGSIKQTFVAAAPTISRIGIRNREELRATVSIWRESSGTRLFSSAINASEDIAISGVGITGLVPGETLSLRIDTVQATAANPNHALNFFYTTSGPGSGAATTANTCPWASNSLRGPGFTVPGNADLVAYVAT